MKFVVLGGGIAGVSCAERLASLSIESSISLVTATPLLKAVVNLKSLGRTIESFDVQEHHAEEYSLKQPGINVIKGAVKSVNLKGKQVVVDGCESPLPFDRLLIALGTLPKLVLPDHPLVLGIRDVESVDVLKKRLLGARRIVIVGNGGISMELVQAIGNCEVIWAVKDKHIGHTFLDSGAAEFVMPGLFDRSIPLVFEYECELAQIADADHVFQLQSDHVGPSVKHGCEWPLHVQLTNGREYGCDFVVSATGVSARAIVDSIPGFDVLKKGTDGGLLVDTNMECSVPNVFAAGDCVTACEAGVGWSEHWFQMRLWSQARVMGVHAALHMMKGSDCASECKAAEEQLVLCWHLELFSHVTTFFGHKVVLLGRFNGQGLREKCRVHQRVVEGESYVKLCVGEDGRLRGALLVGESDLGETMENLILDGIDLRGFGDDLLDPRVDLEGFFD